MIDVIRRFRHRRWLANPPYEALDVLLDNDTHVVKTQDLDVVHRFALYSKDGIRRHVSSIPNAEVNRLVFAYGKLADNKAWAQAIVTEQDQRNNRFELWMRFIFLVIGAALGSWMPALARHFFPKF